MFGFAGSLMVRLGLSVAMGHALAHFRLRVS
jgi:hypothetical protein